MDAVVYLRYKQDMARGVAPVAMDKLFATGDERAHHVVVEVFRDGQPMDLSGVTVGGGFLRADGGMVLLSGTVSGNRAEVVLPQACYRISGAFGLAIRLMQGSEISTVFWGTGIMTRVDSDAVIDPDGKVPSLQELLARIDEMKQATAAAQTAAETAASAAERAGTAAGAAESAVQDAQSATERAEAAADAAGEAAEKAGATAQEAGRATEAARSAAEAAAEAAQRIEAAVKEANDVAQWAGEAAEAAIEGAGAAASAAGAADIAAKKAGSAAAEAARWQSVTATVTMLAPDALPVVTLTDTDTGKQMSFELPRGLTGSTPQLQIGEVRTGEPGSDASAWLTGTPEAPVLNLSIPAGQMGRVENLTVCGVSPDGKGNIALTAGDVGALPVDGTAASANALRDAHTIQVDLGSSSGTAFNGTRDIKPGVSGVLGIGNGGTGAQTASQALVNLGGAYGVGSTLPWAATTRMICLGRFMASVSYLYINLSLCKPFRGVPRITSFEGAVYGDGKSVSFSSSNNELNCSIASYNGELGIIYILINNSTRFFADFQDNVPVGVVFTDLGITFNEGSSVSADTRWFKEAT